MGTGYTRNDTANNIADGNVINASDLDGEFDAIQSAFNGTTGHSHDGTTGEGPQIDTAGLADSAVTTAKINNDAVTLGTKTSGNYIAAGAVSGVGLSGSASSEGATFTVTSNATDANTASTIVARDASGNFSAGTITATLSGNATTATTATTANSVAADSVALGTDTTGNYVAAGAVSGVGLSGSASAEGATFTVTSNATSANTASTIVARDASGNFSAGTITASLTGTASNAALLDNIDSTSFLRSDAADTKTSGDLSFSDSVKAQFGAGNDLQIYHDGLNSYVSEQGTGNLNVLGTSIDFLNSAANKYYMSMTDGGSLTLYHNGGSKLATTSTGIDVTGAVSATSTVTGSVLRTNNVGTNAAPSILFDQDGGHGATGFTGGSSSEYVAVINNGSETARFTNAGHVGIGTSSPTLDASLAGLSVNASGRVVSVYDTEGATLKLGDPSFGANRGLGITLQGTSAAISNCESGELRFGTGNTERMRIDSSGNVGIGVTNPSSFYSGSDTLVVNGGMTIYSTGSSRLEFADGTTGSEAYVGNIVYDHTGNFMRFASNISEAMRIDSSQNLLVGKTVTSLNTDGIRLKGNDTANFVVNDGAVLDLNRRTSDGSIVNLYKDGSTVGRIGVANGDNLYISSDDTNDVGVKFNGDGNRITPCDASGADRNGLIDLGESSARYKDLYLSSGIYAGSGFGSSGQLLTSNGTTATWQDAPAGGAGYFQGENGVTGDATNGLGDIFRVHEDTLNTNVTIASGNNALCAGPLTIATGVTLTINGNLSIV